MLHVCTADTTTLVLDLGDKLALVVTSEQPSPSLGNLFKWSRNNSLGLDRHLALLDPADNVTSSLGDLGDKVDNAETLDSSTLLDQVEEIVEGSGVTVVGGDETAEADNAVLLDVGDDGVENLSTDVLESTVSSLRADGIAKVLDESGGLVVDTLVGTERLDKGDLFGSTSDGNDLLGSGDLGELDGSGSDGTSLSARLFCILTQQLQR